MKILFVKRKIDLNPLKERKYACMCLILWCLGVPPIDIGGVIFLLLRAEYRDFGGFYVLFDRSGLVELDEVAAGVFEDGDGGRARLGRLHAEDDTSVFEFLGLLVDVGGGK